MKHTTSSMWPEKQKLSSYQNSEMENLVSINLGNKQTDYVVKQGYLNWGKTIMNCFNGLVTLSLHKFASLQI